MYICGVYVCCGHVLSGKTQSALLLVGPGAMQMQQPCLSQDIATITTYFPLARYFFLNYYYLCGNCWHYSIPQMHFIIYSISQREICTLQITVSPPYLLKSLLTFKNKKKSAVAMTPISLWNLDQDNLTGDKITAMTKRTIYFPQERADVFAVHQQQLPHQGSRWTSPSLNLFTIRPMGHSP